MRRKLMGMLLLALAAALLIRFYVNLLPTGIEAKGGIILFGLNLNDLVSLLGGIVSLISGIVTLASKRKTLISKRKTLASKRKVR